MQGDGPVMATPTTGLSSATAVKASVRPTSAKQFCTKNSMNIIFGKHIHILLIVVPRITFVNQSGLTEDFLRRKKFEQTFQYRPKVAW